MVHLQKLRHLRRTYARPSVRPLCGLTTSGPTLGICQVRAQQDRQGCVVAASWLMPGQQRHDHIARDNRNALCCQHSHINLLMPGTQRHDFITAVNQTRCSPPPSHAGTTVSVALCTGWLLTVANTGDSAVVLDTGCSLLELTLSHRIQSNMDEQARLKAAGQQLAPLGFHLQGPAKPGEPGVGPMRLWPGGLCVSRSIGDLDAGAEVVPVPHIRQVGVYWCVTLLLLNKKQQ
jgi:hypothetical protein